LFLQKCLLKVVFNITALVQGSRCPALKGPRGRRQFGVLGHGRALLQAAQGCVCMWNSLQPWWILTIFNSGQLMWVRSSLWNDTGRSLEQCLDMGKNGFEGRVRTWLTCRTEEQQARLGEGQVLWVGEDQMFTGGEGESVNSVGTEGAKLMSEGVRDKR